MLKFNSHTDFNAYLEKIDEGMRRDNVPVQARPLQGLSRISIENSGHEFDITEAMDLNKEDIIGYEGHVLTWRIIKWFEDLYGDRLKINFWAGKSVALVRGDPYLMNIPLALGDVVYTYDIETLGRSGDVRSDGQTIVNVFDSLYEITEATISRVSRGEGLRLANELKANTYKFHRATEIEKYIGTFDVRPDLDAAAQHMVTDQANFGLSRWHSLQAAEKGLKSILACQGQDFPKVHDLYQLVHASGMVGISPLSLSVAMCSPAVRYEPNRSTLNQAINAHHGSLDICLAAANQIADVGRLKEDQRPEWVRQLDG